jgi:hypothetical protein
LQDRRQEKLSRYRAAPRCHRLPCLSRSRSRLGLRRTWVPIPLSLRPSPSNHHRPDRRLSPSCLDLSRS